MPLLPWRKQQIVRENRECDGVRPVFSFDFCLFVRIFEKKKMLQNECECAVFSVKRHSEMRRANKYPEYSPHNISSAHAAPYIWNFISTHKHTRTPDPIGSRKWCVCVYFSCSIFITQAQARLRAVCWEQGASQLPTKQFFTCSHFESSEMKYQRNTSKMQYSRHSSDHVTLYHQ